jgi:hypothetical protein
LRQRRVPHPAVWVGLSVWRKAMSQLRRRARAVGEDPNERRKGPSTTG